MADARDIRVLSHSQGSTLAGTPGRDLVSRFINGGGSSSGTPKDTSNFPQRQSPPRQESNEGLDAGKRNKSAPNFADRAHARNYSHAAGATTPVDHLNRTQQKLLLQRASSNIEPQNLVPAVLPRTSTFNLVNGVKNFASTAAGGGGGGGEGRIDPRLQRQYEQAAQEFRVVHRYRNPVADAVSRLTEIPGSPRKNYIPKPSSSSSAGVAKAAAAAGRLTPSRDGAGAASPRHLGVSDGAADERAPPASARRNRVSFELPGGSGGDGEMERGRAASSYGSDDGGARIVRDEAYELCRRLWEMSEVAEAG